MSAASTASTDIRKRPLDLVASTTGWGLYCASSWTWCIGMFLPIILLSRFGWGGFWAFLIPNVLGCAAFGYLFSKESSRRFATNHASAVRWFSVATIAFQVFFLGWSAGAFVYAPDAAASGDAAVAGAVGDTLAWPVLGTILTWTAGAFAFAGRGDLFWRWFATIAAVGSGSLFAIAVFDNGGPPAAPRPEAGASLLGAVPLLALGFIACPSLDATFHRARQQTPSRHAFAIFGLVFAGMLVFAGWVFDGLSPDRIAATLLPLVIAQWTLQLVFTIGAHVREVGLLPGGRLGGRPMLLFAVLVGTIAGLPGIAGEPVYLCFLGLYAIPFPMYVIAAVVAGGRGLQPCASRWVMGLSVILGPLGWLGFIENQTLLLLPAAAGTAIGGWIIGRRFANAPIPPSAAELPANPSNAATTTS